jgi:Mn2+/Fe2+ NRAMP family transporter
MLLFNEVMVSIYLYLLLCLTDFMGDHDKRDLIAWALLIVVVFTVVANLVKFLLVCDWCFTCRKIKKKCVKQKKHFM